MSIDKIDYDINHIYQSLKNEWYLSLDQKLYMTYKELNEDIPFKEFKERLFKLFGIDELEYYTSAVYPELKEYTEEKLLLNKYVVIRALAINETFYTCNPYNNTLLDLDMVYAVSVFYNSTLFINNDFMNTFFTNKQKDEIITAIKYYYLCSIKNEYSRVLNDAVKPLDIEETIKRELNLNKDVTLDELRDKYSEYNPLDISYPDKIYYNCFLKEMRRTLSNEEEFNKIKIKK